MSEKPHPGPLGCGFVSRRVEKVAGTENTELQTHCATGKAELLF